MPNDERNLETLPDGALGLIPLESGRLRTLEEGVA